MFEAVYKTTFEATHTLQGIREDIHPHTWQVEVRLAAETLSPPGMILNYFDLKDIVEAVLPHHTHLNEQSDFAPTAENWARHLYTQLSPQLPQLKSVSVGEFPEFLCTYSP